MMRWLQTFSTVCTVTDADLTQATALRHRRIQQPHFGHRHDARLARYLCLLWRSP